MLVVDETSREALAMIPETSLSGARVVGELDRLITERGKPDVIVSDTWPQLMSRPALEWQKTMSVSWLWLEQAGRPAPFIASFATMARKQCLAGRTREC